MVKAMSASLDLYRTSPEGTEWLGSFLKIEVAIAKLQEYAQTNPGHYYICDQTTGEQVFAEDSSVKEEPQ
jgi:hypothetical protein